MLCRFTICGSTISQAVGSTRNRSWGVYKASSRGQFPLLADARRRWGIDAGGVEFFDLGDCVVMLPVGDSSAA